MVDKISVIPVSNEMIDEMNTWWKYSANRWQTGSTKFWPVKPIEIGEYAVVEYTEGKSNVQVWDFGLRSR